MTLGLLVTPGLLGVLLVLLVTPGLLDLPVVRQVTLVLLDQQVPQERIALLLGLPDQLVTLVRQVRQEVPRDRQGQPVLMEPLALLDLQVMTFPIRSSS